MKKFVRPTEGNKWVVVRIGKMERYRNDFEREADARSFASRQKRNGYSVLLIEPDGYTLELHRDQ